MHEIHRIITTPTGHFRAERLFTRDGQTTYRSATFTDRGRAREWIEREQAEPAAPACRSYVIVCTEENAWTVTLLRRGERELLGQFETQEEAEDYVKRMTERDAE